jgi:hypothetical protein
MPRKRSVEKGEAFKRIIESVEDYVRETHQFPGTSEISKKANLPSQQTAEILKTLVGQNQLSIVYQARSHPTLYAPTYMMQEIFRAQTKPSWLSVFAFSERDDLKDQINKAREDLSKYDLLEGLLYRTDTPLQDSVEYALRLFEYENVIHYKDDKDNPDLSFTFDGKQYLVEVKGKSKEADKDDVLQLEGWMKAELDKGADPDNLVGVLVVNHFRTQPPNTRGDFLTPKARTYAKRYNFKVLTTVRIFEWAQKILKKELSIDEVRSLFVKGEKNE